MANPAILVCDSDALAQLFLSNEIRPLRHLQEAYGVQPVIVQEVDLELRWVGKYKDRFVQPLEKALRGRVLKILDPTLFQSLVGTAPVGASWENFQSLGAQYDGRIHRGEAYTFAAAITLEVPALSNDFSAIKTLEGNLLAVPRPVLRAFDLLAFCLNSGHLELKACESVRSELLKNGEGIPKPFAHASFEDGLNDFAPRLHDGPNPTDRSPISFSSPLHIVKL